MPFVDYYNLITWKTLAICIFGVKSSLLFRDTDVWIIISLTSFLKQTEVASANYVMKTDDDAFIRVDEVLGSLEKIKVSKGLLYGLINSDSQPHRSTDSKWYTSLEVIR